MPLADNLVDSGEQRGWYDPTEHFGRLGAPGRLCDVGPATPATELEGDQLGELGRDVCHRIFSSTQAASRAEQGADFAESFVCRVVHNGDEQVTR